MSYDNQQHLPAPISFHEAENVVQRQTSQGNLHQGIPLTYVPSLDKDGNAVQLQTSPENRQQGKPSTDVPSLDKVVKDLRLKDSGPVGGSVPDFPPSSATPYLKDSLSSIGSSVPSFPPSPATPPPPEKETNCIKKCLAALSPCCG